MNIIVVRCENVTELLKCHFHEHKLVEDSIPLVNYHKGPDIVDCIKRIDDIKHMNEIITHPHKPSFFNDQKRLRNKFSRR